MPDDTQQSELDRLRAFELRMQTEGAAGFADGLEPWDTWREPDCGGDHPTWKNTPHCEQTEAGKSLCEKLLSSIAMVAVATLAVGIGGIYLSTQEHTPRVAAGSIQPPPVAEPAVQTADLSQAGPVIRDTPALVDAPPKDAAAASPPVPEQVAQLTTDNPAIAQPAPAGGDAPAADSTAKIAQTASAAHTDAIDTETSAADNSMDLAASLPAPAAGAPAQLSQLTPPVSADAPVRPPAAADTPLPEKDGDGIWVVNISSYNFESMARRKLAEFKKKGVSGEVFPATVKGRRIYRVRATGYDSYAEAKTWVSLLQDRLGVDSAWVSKR